MYYVKHTHLYVYISDFNYLFFLLTDKNMFALFRWYNRKRSKNNSLVEYGVLWTYVQG